MSTQLSSGSTAVNSSPNNSICDLVDQDLTTSLALLHLLEREQEALQERDPEVLRELLEEKTGLLNTLDAGAQQRAEILTELNRPTDKHAWESLLDALGDNDLKEHWESLKDTIVECQEINEINGKIIARSQQSVHSLMQILKGKADSPSLYTQNGRSDTIGFGGNNSIQI